MAFLKRVLAGNDGRRSRFHTARNEIVPVAPAIMDLVRNFGSKVLTKFGGERPPLPWWPTRAIPIVEAFLRPDMSAIEFGSGSSSIWIGARVRSLLTVEDNPVWAETTRRRIDMAGLANVTVHLAQKADYWSAGGTGTFDFAVVDGSYRWKCLEHVLPLVRAGGAVYLDNADSDKDAHHYDVTGQTYLAQRVIEQFVASRPGSRIEKIASMTNGELFASEGWLVHIG